MSVSKTSKTGAAGTKPKARGVSRKKAPAARQKPTPKRAAAKSAPSRVDLSRGQLQEAAKLRSEGATWNAIREAFSVKLGSSAWFRRWEAEGIEHVPAGERSKAQES